MPKPNPVRCVPGLNCLAVCGLRDGIAAIGQFCIDTRLAFGLKGYVKKGLFFRGSESVPFGSAIRPVAELIDYLLTGHRPAFVTGDGLHLSAAASIYKRATGAPNHVSVAMPHMM